MAYTADEAVLAHPVPFPFLLSEDLRVHYLSAVDQEDRYLVEGEDYEVSGGEGEIGTVTLLWSPTTGATLTITRELDFLQPMDLQPQLNYSAKTHEDTADRITYLLQQLNDRVAELEAIADLGTIAGYTILARTLTFTASADPEGSFPKTVAVPAGFTAAAVWMGKPTNSDDANDTMQTTPQVGKFSQAGTVVSLHHISGLEGGVQYSFTILILGTQA